MSPYMMGGMYSGMGMMGGGLGMMGGMGMGLNSYMFSLNQFLFSIQSVIFSLGQAVQIVGMNAQQIQGVVKSVGGMVENYLGNVKNVDWEGCLNGVFGDDVKRRMLGDTENDDRGESNEPLSQEEIVQRRRLAAFRWSMTLTVSYVVYRTVRRMIRALIFGDGSAYNRQYHGRGYISDSRYHGQYGGYGRRGGYGGGYGGYGGGYNGGMSPYDPYGGSGYY